MEMKVKKIKIEFLDKNGKVIKEEEEVKK